nr:7577_t:CDS:2 [Entrophospora candida]
MNYETSPAVIFSELLEPPPLPFGFIIKSKHPIFFLNPSNNLERFIIDEIILENEDAFVTVPKKLFHGTNKTKYSVKRVGNSPENNQRLKFSPADKIRQQPQKPVAELAAALAEKKRKGGKNREEVQKGKS